MHERNNNNTHQQPSCVGTISSCNNETSKHLCSYHSNNEDPLFSDDHIIELEETQRFIVLKCEQCKQDYNSCCVGLDYEELLANIFPSTHRNRSNRRVQQHKNRQQQQQQQQQQTYFYLCRLCSETRIHQIVYSEQEYLHLTRRSHFAHEYRENFIPHVYCICDQKDDGRVMIQCGACEEWYHEDCINISLNQQKNVHHVDFICARCSCGNGNMFIEEKQQAKRFYPSYKRCRVCVNSHTKREKDNEYNLAQQCLIRSRSLIANRRRQQLRLDAGTFLNFRFDKFQRFEVTEGPWSLAAIRGSNRFLVGTSQNSLKTYKLEEEEEEEAIVGGERAHTYTNWINQKTVLNNYPSSITLQSSITTSCSGFAHISLCPEYSQSIVFGSCWFNRVMNVIDLEVQKEICASGEHTAPVRSFDFSRDHNCLLTSSFDKTMKLWDSRAVTSQMEKPIETIRGHTNHVTGARFLSSNTILSTSADSSMRIWDIRRLSNSDSSHITTACLKRFDFEGDISLISLSLSDDRSTVAVNTDIGSVFTFGTSDLVHVPDSTDIISPRHILKGHFSSNWKTLQASFIPGTSLISVGSEDGTVCLWHEPSGIAKKRMLHSTCVWGTCYIDSNDTLISSSEDMSLCAIKLFEGRDEDVQLTALDGKLNDEEVLCRFADGSYFHAQVLDYRYCPDADDILFDVQFRGWPPSHPESKCLNIGSALVIPEEVLQPRCRGCCEVEHSAVELVQAQNQLSKRLHHHQIDHPSSEYGKRKRKCNNDGNDDLDSSVPSLFPTTINLDDDNVHTMDMSPPGKHTYPLPKRKRTVDSDRH